ncbi:sugar-binding domain-containing protein [Lentisphaerota bacterium WC36G]|nr:glycoside hydrolase family 2 protein [Lentisphaerae bacterium WC36]
MFKKLLNDSILKIGLSCCSLLGAAAVNAQFSCSTEQTSKAKEFSTAGYYQIANSDRRVYNFNVGWRFLKGDVKDAFKKDFDDSKWIKVNTPHGLELLPVDASGGFNYQGKAWYRKHFSVPQNSKNKRINLYFEAIMGKCDIYVNGKLVKKHYGGYLPISLDVTDYLDANGKNVIAVMADNSDDPDYPVGQRQAGLDFSYFGGIYRDVYLISHNDTFITDANSDGVEVAQGGVFVHARNLKHAENNGDKNYGELFVQAEIKNLKNTADNGYSVELNLYDKSSKECVATSSQKINIAAKNKTLSKQTLKVDNAIFWNTNNPYLYNLVVKVKDNNSNVIDGYKMRVALRTIDFRGRDGFFLNGKPFKGKLMGVNRHQDFAIIGNALPNSGQYRDAYKIRNGALKVVRAAHYPMDPAFMDACDELGIFVIVPTPGWQFFNKKPIFSQRVFSDIQQMVRRDRNRPSVLMWEPILNETRYPMNFAKTAYNTTHAEYPLQGCFAAADEHLGGEMFDVIYTHPKRHLKDYEKIFAMNKCVFTREWGDNVDDWGSQNSDSRIFRWAGERAQIIQALHFAWTSFDTLNISSNKVLSDAVKNKNPRLTHLQTSYETIAMSNRGHVGGTLWCGFDHNRGGVPFMFTGGMMDYFRLPKYSYYMFKAQGDPKIDHPVVDKKPFAFIANEMTPWSSEDVWIFSNCDEVRLKAFGKVIGTKKVKRDDFAMPAAPVVFRKAYSFHSSKILRRARKFDKSELVVEGLIDGKVVTTTRKTPQHMDRPSTQKLNLTADYSNKKLVADGSDLIVVNCQLTGSHGMPVRASDYIIKFTVEGEGEIIQGENLNINPQKLQWGEATILVRSTTKAGKIKVKAELLHKRTFSNPVNAELEIISVEPSLPMLYTDVGEKLAELKIDNNSNSAKGSETNEKLRKKLAEVQQELNNLRNQKMLENQQKMEELQGTSEATK